MAKFLTRVELHGANHSDNSYETLHSEMERRGFVRTIPTDSQTRKLPTAEYFCAGSFTAKQVYDAAKGAANPTGKTSGIISAEITEYCTDCPAV